MYLVDVATSIKEDSYISLDEARPHYGWDDKSHKVFGRYLGYKSVVLHSSETLLMTIQETLSQIFNTWPFLRTDLHFLLYCHSLHSTYPLADRNLIDPINMISCSPVCVSLTQSACSSSLIALEVMSNLLGSVKQRRNGIILTGEKCFHRMTRYVVDNGIFSEAVTAAYFTNDIDIGKAQFVKTDNLIINNRWSQLKESSRQERNVIDHQFVRLLGDSVKNVCMKSSVDLVEIGSFLPHHMSPPTAIRVVESLGLPRSVVLDSNLYTVGHSFCGDIFINLHSCIYGEGVPADKPFVIGISAGVTGNITSTLFRWLSK